MRVEKRTPPGGLQAVGGKGHRSNSFKRQYTTIEALAEQHGGRRITDGRDGGARFLIHCPVHGDRNRSAVLFEGEDGGIGYFCHAGCESAALRSALGLDAPAGTAAKRRGPTMRQLRVESIRHMVQGTQPERLPPYTRELPRHGDVFILLAHEEWPRRPVPALVLPPGHPPGAYRWPVTGRRVCVIDLSTNPPPGHFHYGAEPWRANPWLWREERRGWLRGFASILINRDGASIVRVLSEADRVIYRLEVAYAA